MAGTNISGLPGGFDSSQMLSPTGFSNLRPANAAATAQSPHANPISGAGKQLLSKVTGGVQGVGTALDSFGATNFGLGTVHYSNIPSLVSNAGAVAPSSAAGSAGTAVTGGLGSILGGAGTGFGIGSMIGGWMGNDGPGSSIGGAIGGAIGAATGISSGIAMGATLGSVVPGLGTVIGAVAGSLLGGMFGGKKPNPAGYMNQINIGSDGTLAGGAFAGKHTSTDTFSPYINDFQSYLQGQVKKYGVTTLNPEVQAAFTYDVNGTNLGGDAANNSRIGIYNEKNEGSGSTWVYNPNDANSKNTAYDGAWNHLLSLSGIDPNNLTAVIPTSASEIRIPRNTGPSDWDTFLANYRTAHPVEGQPNAS